MKNKDRHVFLECTDCKNRNYAVGKKQRADYKIEKKKFCPFCAKHTVHKEKKL